MIHEEVIDESRMRTKPSTTLIILVWSSSAGSIQMPRQRSLSRMLDHTTILIWCIIGKST